MDNHNNPDPVQPTTEPKPQPEQPVTPAPVEAEQPVRPEHFSYPIGEDVLTELRIHEATVPHDDETNANPTPFAGDIQHGETGPKPVTEKLTNFDADELAKDFSKHEAKRSAKSKWFKLVIALSGVGVVAVLVAVIVTVFKLDSAVFPVSMKGAITDYANRPLANVKVCMQTQCVTTDASGLYQFSNLQYGKFTLSAEAQNFKALQEEIDLQRGTNEVNRSLLALGIGDINGALVVPTNTSLITKDLSITFDGQPVDVDNANGFRIVGKSMGTYKLELKSPSYLDISADVEVKEGVNTLPPIKLEPAMDITFKVNDWVLGTPLAQYTVKMGDKTIPSDNDGIVLLKDLPLTDHVGLDLVKNGYNNKTVSATALKQALNELDAFTMVKSGRIFYLSNRLGNSNIYAANYDGSEEKLLTDNKGDSINPYLFSDGKTIGFLSNRDKVADTYGTVIDLPYTVDINGTKINKLAAGNYGAEGLSYYNWQSMKRAYVKYEYVGGVSQQMIYFGGIDGATSALLVQRTGGYINNIRIANSGNFLVYSWSGDVAAQNGIFYVNTATGESRKIYNSASYYADILDISSDLKNVLIRVTENGTYNSDLYLVNVSGNKTVRITNTSSYEAVARISADGAYVYFTTARDNKTDLYRINIAGATEQRLTTDGKVSGFYLPQNSLIFFTSDQNLYTTDSAVLGSAVRKLTENVTNNSFALDNSPQGDSHD